MGFRCAMAVDALRTLQASDKRGEVVEIAGATVINDCYNSNPKALNAMVNALAKMPARRHIVVAGEMLELGSDGRTTASRMRTTLWRAEADFLLGVRGLAKTMVEAASGSGVRSEFVATAEDAGEWLARNVRDWGRGFAEGVARSEVGAGH